jgi:DNA-binding transcriptional LysR family regulator
LACGGEAARIERKEDQTVELYQVRYFVAVSRFLNFTRAAEYCNVTQPAMTKAVRKLECELGGELIHRERQLTQLTELGRIVLPAMGQIVEAAESMRVLSREYQRKGSAPLRIGLAPCISANFLAAPLADIARFVPGLQVEIFEETTSRLVEMLFEGEVNAAIAGDAVSLSERVDHWVLFEERFLILTGQQSPLAELVTIPVDELVGATWLERTGWEFVESFWNARLPESHRRKVVHHGRHESDLQHMVSAGLGIMLAPEHMPRLPSLVARRIEGDPFRWVVQLLVMAGRRYTPALDAFVKIARLRNWKADLCAIISDSEASIAVRRRARPARHRLHTGMHFRRSGFGTIEK